MPDDDNPVNSMLDALSDSPAAEDIGTNDFLAQFDEVLGSDGNPIPQEQTTPEDAPPANTDTPEQVEATEASTDGDDILTEEEVPSELGSRASTAAKENFKKSRAVAAKYKQEAAEARRQLEAREKAIAEREARIKELEQSTSKLPELEEKAKYIEEAEKELAIARVEGTREYKETIEKPLAAIADAADALATANELDFNNLISVLGERDAAKRRAGLKEIIAGLDAVDQQEVIRMANDTQQLLTKRDTIREQAAEARKELETRTREQETQSQQKAREAFEAATKNAVEEFKKRIPFVPTAEGETLDGVFGNLLEQASKVNFDAASPETKAFAATAGAVLPRVVKQLRHVQKELETYKQRIAKTTAATPKVGSESPAPSRQPARDLPDIVAAAFGQSQSANVLDRLE